MLTKRTLNVIPIHLPDPKVLIRSYSLRQREQKVVLTVEREGVAARSEVLVVVVVEVVGVSERRF